VIALYPGREDGPEDEENDKGYTCSEERYRASGKYHIFSLVDAGRVIYGQSDRTFETSFVQFKYKDFIKNLLKGGKGIDKHSLV